MPETLGDYLAHGWEKGLRVGPWAALAAVVCLGVGAALARRMGERALAAGAGAALALSFALSAQAVEASWWPVGHGWDWLLPLSFVAAALAVLEAVGGPVWLRWGARLACVGGAAYLVAPPSTGAGGPETQRAAAAGIVAGSLACWVALERVAVRLDARVLLTSLAIPVAALGGMVIFFGHEDGLGTALMGLSIGLGLVWALALVRRGALPTTGVAAPLALIVPPALVVASVGGMAPSAAGLALAAVAAAPWVSGWRRTPVEDGAPEECPCRWGIGSTLAAALVLTLGAGGDAYLRAEIERIEPKVDGPTIAPEDGGYDPDYGYGSEGSDEGDDLPY